MIKLVLGALLVTTSVVAQTTPQNAKTSSPKSATASATKPKAMSTTNAAATARSNKPIPPPSLKDNLESKDNAIPSYKKEKDAGKHKIQNRYTPRRTESGARKDTIIARKRNQ